MGLSTDRILSAVVREARALQAPAARHLDIGPGTGALIEMIRASHPGVESWACDYTDALMKTPGQKVEIVNLDHGNLPYPDATFQLVTCTEVIEHLENYRRVIREVFRVTTPGGLVIFSTPNILNLRSRLRFLFFGFWNLFGPLPIGRAETFSTTGHITPVSYFYLAHALEESGFAVNAPQIDRFQRSAFPALLVLWPLIAIFGSLARLREVRHFETIDSANAGIVKSMNSVKMLLGRTVIVAARKADRAPD